MLCWERLPEKFIERLENVIVDEKEQESVLTSFCKKKPLTVRINTLKTSREKLLEEMKQDAISLMPVTWYNDAFVAENVTSEQLTNLNTYKQGHFYIQNLSSMIPALALNPTNGEQLLDLCAAPGSKTTQLATLMQNTGKLIANDKSKQRLYKLNANVKQQGVTNVKTISLPGEIIWKRYPNFFDKTLVDAPCSMEGRFFAEDEETYRDWSLKKIKLLSHMQRWLLRSAVTATKPGGVIVYSTCTISPEENEEVIDWLLKTEMYPLDIEPLKITNLPAGNPLLEWKNKQFDKRIKNCRRILPNDIMEGFFVAKIKKL